MDPMAFLPDNGIARLIGLLLLLILGWGGKGALVAIREDRRKGEKDDVELLALVEEVTATKILQLRADLDEERKERLKLAKELRKHERRVWQLEGVLERKGYEIPAWPNGHDPGEPK